MSLNFNDYLKITIDQAQLMSSSRLLGVREDVYALVMSKDKRCTPEVMEILLQKLAMLNDEIERQDLNRE